jgi:hypothetical protein
VLTFYHYDKILKIINLYKEERVLIFFFFLFFGGTGTWQEERFILAHSLLGYSPYSLALLPLGRWQHSTSWWKSCSLNQSASSKTNKQNKNQGSKLVLVAHAFKS